MEAELEINKISNETTVLRPLPLSTWFPYDEQKHYVFSFIWQIIDGIVAASFVTYTDCLIFSLIIFPLGQITILNYNLSKLDKYIESFMNITNTPFEKASYLVFRNCIIHHQDTIRYGSDFQIYINSNGQIVLKGI